jgi:hypothetical protein
MNEQHGRAFSSRPIPKRPSQTSEQPPSLPKRSSLLPVPSLPEQSPAPPEPSSIPSDEVDNRSLLAEMAPINYEALRLKASFERKKQVSRYPALVHRAVSQSQTLSQPNVLSEEQDVAIPYSALSGVRRSRKRGLLAWIMPFLQ